MTEVTGKNPGIPARSDASAAGATRRPGVHDAKPPRDRSSGKREAPPQRLDRTLTKGLSVLEALASAPGPRGVSDLARELDLTKSNVFRLLQTLVALGYARATEDRQYRATLKTWQVGRAVIEGYNLRDAARPAMQMLSAETGETIYLAVREGLSVVYIDKIDSTRPIRSWNPVGGTAPIHCVGTGKAILAAEYDRLRDSVLATLRPHTDRTIVTAEALDADMARTRARGCAVDRGEFRDRIRSYGAAITLADGSVAGAVGVSVPEVNLRDGDETRICDLVRLAAEDISRRMRQG